jgi:hypothetical protein
MPFASRLDGDLRVGRKGADCMDLLKRPRQAGAVEVEGVYVAHFLSKADHYGEGIVVVDGGRIHGGDLDHVYVGKYALSNDEFSATLEVSNHSGTFSSVLGPLAQYRLALKGKVKKHQDITCHGTVEERPDLAIQINLHKLSALAR